MLVVAFNYGGRQELARAAQRLAVEAVAGRLDPAKIDANELERRLDTAGIPDPDLIIRTSGEQRLSNFLLWQSAYAEFVVLSVYWPDFDQVAFEEAIAEFRRRERRFGGLEARVRA
jgi:undecaprenyl diphosphate synthase